MQRVTDLNYGLNGLLPWGAYSRQRPPQYSVYPKVRKVRGALGSWVSFHVSFQGR